MSYYSASPTALQHPHEGFGSKRQPKVSTHVGKDVFISMNASESSLSPLPIPEDLKAKEGAISTITCMHTVTIVINGQVYLYFKSLDRWSPSAGVTSPAFEHSHTIAATWGQTPSARSSAGPFLLTAPGAQSLTVAFLFQRLGVTHLHLSKAK